LQKKKSSLSVALFFRKESRKQRIQIPCLSNHNILLNKHARTKDAKFYDLNDTTSDVSQAAALILDKI